MHLEPDSVILRDPMANTRFRCWNRTTVPTRFLSLCCFRSTRARRSIFLVQRENKQEVVTGKIIRSGYTPHNYMAMNRYGQQYTRRRWPMRRCNEQPIIEVDGKLRFGLPGVPLFPSLGDETILKPTLQWLLSSDQAGPIRTEFSYVTGGLTWEADYNIVAPDKAMSLTWWLGHHGQPERENF